VVLRSWGGTGKGVAGRPSAGGRRTIGGPRKRQRSFVRVEIERLLKHSPTRVKRKPKFRG